MEVTRVFLHPIEYVNGVMQIRPQLGSGTDWGYS